MDNPTLLAFLWNDSAHVGSVMLTDVLKSGVAVSSTTPLQTQWKQIERALDDQVSAAFSLDFVSILVRAWADVSALRAAADPTRTTKGVTREITLLEHEIEMVDRPGIDVTVDGAKAFSVDLEIRLTLNLKLADITVRDARIRTISLGGCEGNISLMSGPAVLLQHPLPGPRFPLSFTIPGGLAIGADSSSAS